jgi:hypothetical protein
MLPSFDELKAMSSKELNDLLDREVKVLLENAKPENRQKLEQIHSQIRLKVRAKRMNYVQVHTAMWEMFVELNSELQKLRL